MVMATGDTRWSKVYDQMKTEERWRELLGRTRSVCVVNLLTPQPETPLNIQLETFRDGERQPRLDDDCG